MSVYGGFCTRAQEKGYGRHLENLILMLQHRVKRSILKEEVDEEDFAQEFKATWKALQKLEENKFQPPRYSEMCSELAICLSGFVDMQTPSRRKSLLKPQVNKLDSHSKRSLSTSQQSQRSLEQQTKEHEFIKSFQTDRKGVTRPIKEIKVREISSRQREVKSQRQKVRASAENLGTKQPPKLQAFYNKLFEKKFITQNKSDMQASPPFQPKQVNEASSPRRNKKWSPRTRPDVSASAFISRRQMDLSQPLSITHRHFVYSKDSKENIAYKF